MHIAVIVKELVGSPTWRTAITGENRDVIIRGALRHRREWELKSPGGHYRIFVGELSGEIISPPMVYEEIPMEDMKK
jgi:hypothetical protein